MLHVRYNTLLFKYYALNKICVILTFFLYYFNFINNNKLRSTYFKNLVTDDVLLITMRENNKSRHGQPLNNINTFSHCKLIKKNNVFAQSDKKTYNA